MPNAPTVFVGKRGEFPTGIHSVGMANGAQETTVEQAVGVGVRWTQIDFVEFRQSFDGVSFCGAANGGTVEIASAPAALLFEARGAHQRMKHQAARFEFTSKRGSGEICERFESAAYENNRVTLAEVPGNAGNSLLEQRERVHIAENEVARNTRQITLVAVLDGQKALRQQAQRLPDPTEIIDRRNFLVAAKFREQAAFERRLGKQGPVEIEESGDPAAAQSFRTHALCLSGCCLTACLGSFSAK